MRQRAGRARVTGQIIGLLDLRQDLRLADHHAVQARCDSEQVLECIRPGAIDHLIDDFVSSQIALFGQELGDRFAIKIDFIAGRCIQLDAIAGTEQHDLAGGKSLAKFAQRRPHLLGREGDPFAKLNGRVMMTAADHLQFHCLTPGITKGAT